MWLNFVKGGFVGGIWGLREDHPQSFLFSFSVCSLVSLKFCLLSFLLVG
jgi:hypothetical protein